MNIQDPKPQDDLDAFLQGEDELSLLLREMPQPSPSARLDAAILAEAERAAARDQTPPAAANDAVLPVSERIRKPSLATRWGVAVGLIAAAALTCLLLMLQSKPHIPRQPETPAQRPIDFRIYPSEADDLEARGRDAAAIPVIPIEAPLPPLPEDIAPKTKTPPQPAAGRPRK